MHGYLLWYAECGMVARECGPTKINRVHGLWGEAYIENIASETCEPLNQLESIMLHERNIRHL